MKYAVHNFHTPAILMDPDNPRTASLTAPLHEADTFEDAECWRLDNRPFDPAAGSKTSTIGSDRNR